MKEETDQLTDEMKCLLTVMRHREHLSDHLNRLATILKRRARVHDRSKLKFDEFEGFTRINKVARQHKYGTNEYREALRSENKETGCIGLHYARNTHHPECHVDVKKMDFLDIIEMVFDWAAAVATYQDSLGGLAESVCVHRSRFDFSEEQWWLVDQVVSWIEGGEDG